MPDKARSFRARGTARYGQNGDERIMAQRVTQKMLENMVDTFNKYHNISMHGRAHKLIISPGINGLDLVWYDIENHTHSQSVSPSSAMSNWETYLVLKALTDGEIYREQAKLTIGRNY